MYLFLLGSFQLCFGLAVLERTYVLLNFTAIGCSLGYLFGSVWLLKEGTCETLQVILLQLPRTQVKYRFLFRKRNVPLLGGCFAATSSSPSYSCERSLFPAALNLFIT